MSDPLAELTPSQFRSALGLAADLSGCHSGAEVTQQLKRLPGIVGSDTLLVGEVAQAGGEDGGATLAAEEEPSGAYDQESFDVFTDLWHQHPVVTRHFAAPSRRALMISDFLSDREWRRTELYGDCYRARLGLGWEIATQIRFGPERQVCAALGRTGCDFGEGDRALLDVINPHLRASYARIEHEATREERLGLLERGIEGRGELVVTVDRRGCLRADGPAARAILERWFDDEREPGRLPAPVEAWRRRQRGAPDPAPLELRRQRQRLRLRLVPGTKEDAILIAEHRDAPPDPALLERRLPISRREAEVLALLAQGWMNAAIAAELGLSANTIARYVERLYLKIGVHNRVDATLAARRALED